MHLPVWQRLLLVLICFAIAATGFMIKLPVPFRGMDKEMHSGFYFIAAAFLNLLFAGTSLWKHIVVFIALLLFGIGIEYLQEYSNHFFHRTIHGRYDPDDVDANLRGLIAFSVFWIIVCLWLQLRRRTKASS